LRRGIYLGSGLKYTIALKAFLIVISFRTDFSGPRGWLSMRPGRLIRGGGEVYRAAQPSHARDPGALHPAACRFIP